MTRPERKLLRDCSVALDHWLHQYAPEFCEKGDVEKTAKTLYGGGTLAYIAKLQQRIRKTLK